MSDYTQLVASGLASAGDAVHVWSPSVEGKGGDDGSQSAGVIVHRELGRLAPPDLRRVGLLLDEFSRPRRLLVQWVPHGYGYRAMNLPFCLWLWKRASVKGDIVELMVHEPFLTFRNGSWKQSGVAAVHRLMTAILLNAARRIWMTIPAWEARLRPYALGRRLQFKWLPVASNIPVIDDPSGVSAVRACYAPDREMIVGHFGTYGRRIADLLTLTLPALLRDSSSTVVLLLGRGGEGLRAEIVREHADLSSRIHATGALGAADLSRHVSACDLMIQPYPDGVSSRRTSAMVGLSHGKPILTTSGHLTESLWKESGAVLLSGVEDVTALVELARRALMSERERMRLGHAAQGLYQERFDFNHIISALRG